jgi:selenide,water dikinase
MDILYDAQTSGGLLISVEGDKATVLIEQLHSRGVKQAAVIGEVLDSPKGRLLVE